MEKSKISYKEKIHFIGKAFICIDDEEIKKIIPKIKNKNFLTYGFSKNANFQTFIHIGVNANLLPTTGMTLPFLSYGGSSLISSGIVAGIILNYTSLGVKKLNE